LYLISLGIRSAEVFAHRNILTPHHDVWRRYRRFPSASD
jgi:predicted phosphoadenosine phosphosulfate sulfurtransferase